MKVSIIIRSYNEAEHIGKLLLGIAAQSLAVHDIIVVDSGSTDDTIAIARKHGAKVIEIDTREFTFGRALNVGCRAATGDILVFASSHVYPTRRTWLFELTKPFEDDRVVLTYGKQRGEAVNKFSEHQIFKAWFPERSICPQISYFCNNANCAVRRSVWLDEPYDETLTGLEDLAWAKNAQEKGGWIAYASRAEVIHVHDETWKGVRNRYRREAMALRKIDKTGRFSVFDFVRTLLTNLFADFLQAGREGRLLKETKSILAFRYNQFLGTYQGHNGPSEVTAELRRIFYFPQLARTPDAEDLCPLEHEVINYEHLQSADGASRERRAYGHRLAVVGSGVPKGRVSAGKT